VIHAGIYYPPASLKAALCIEGKALLYDFCVDHGVGHTRLGKLIVATHADQTAQLDAMLANARANGVTDLERLSKARIAALEPELSAMEGLLSPSTGIIDSHQYMLALLGDAQAAGAHLVRDANVTAIAATGAGYQLQIRNAGEETRLDCRILVNSAGLWAWQVARRIEGLDAHFVPPLFLAKGNYLTLRGRNPFRHLVYPVPEPGGLGVHLTIDIGGAARFGPDVEWLATQDPAEIDYAVGAGLAERLAPRIAAYWPAITPALLAPGYSGVRPKLNGPNEPGADFCIQGPDAHGLPGLVNLYGIESPGLTASLAIAARVAEQVA
jgi:L-2-hydroxyglutarate oxidase LhgO